MYIYIYMYIPPDLSPSHDFDEIALSSQYRGHFWKQNSLLCFSKKYLSLTLTGFCVPKRVGYGHPFFIVQSVARLCPVWARMSLSWHSQRHCWLLMYIHRLCWAYHQLCWLWNLVFRPSAKFNRHQCLLCAHHRSGQVSERYCPTPPHPTPCVTWNIFNVAWRMCASASERAVASHHRSAQVSERYCPTPPHPTPCVTWNIFNVAWRMCASASERAVASHHRSGQVSERYCPTPPHPTPCVTWNIFNVAWRMCASASERAVASHHRSAQVNERYCPTPPHHPPRDVKHLQRSMTYVRKCKWTCCGVTS